MSQTNLQPKALHTRLLYPFFYQADAFQSSCQAITGLAHGAGQKDGSL